MGALIAVEFCRDLGLQELILEDDSQLVVRAINDKSTNCQYGQVVNDFHVVLQVFRRWSVEHVKRGASGAAHGSATETDGDNVTLSTMLQILFGWKKFLNVFLIWTYLSLAFCSFCLEFHALNLYEMKEVYLT
jgi:hypothetical protein